MEYSWPGNVRELDHTLSRAIIKALSNGHRKEDLLALTARHLGGEIVDGTATVSVEPKMSSEPSVSLQEAMDEYRRALVQQRLHQYSNNYAATARSLGLDRGNFHRLLKRLGLK